MNENYVREKNCPRTVDVNVWGQNCLQATPPSTSTGFVPDCHCEETGYKSYYVDSSNKQVPQGHFWQQESSPSALQQLPSELLPPLLQQQPELVMT